MPSFASDAFSTWMFIELTRTTVTLAAFGIAAWLVLRLTRIRSPRWHRVACVATLLAGWTVAGWTVDVPWYESEPTAVAEV